jgi:hypothetical protein
VNGGLRHPTSFGQLVAIGPRGEVGPQAAALGEGADLGGCFAGRLGFGREHFAISGFVGDAVGVGGEDEVAASGGSALIRLVLARSLFLELAGPGDEVDLGALVVVVVSTRRMFEGVSGLAANLVRDGGQVAIRGGLERRAAARA